MSYAEATKDSPLDGLIITGAPVEHLKFEEVAYWNEFTEANARQKRRGKSSAKGKSCKLLVQRHGGRTRCNKLDC